MKEKVFEFAKKKLMWWHEQDNINLFTKSSELNSSVEWEIKEKLAVF